MVVFDIFVEMDNYVKPYYVPGGNVSIVNFTDYVDFDCDEKSIAREENVLINT